jgi:hypothetical protein
MYSITSIKQFTARGNGHRARTFHQHGKPFDRRRTVKHGNLTDFSGHHFLSMPVVQL